MNSERWQQIKRIFDDALNCAPQERAAFLQKACANDEALRREIETLLASHQHAASFMETPAIEKMAKAVVEDSRQLMTGARISHYEIIKLLGAGGMGEVYLAEDTRLRRKAALKLLPHDLTADITHIKRFKQEARAASALNHPNIITIFEIGEAAGANFIATEYIEGVTLRQRLAHGALSLHESLDIVIQTASALAAAHAAGILHRDIKPENIMLRPDGYVKVLDFGLAKLTERKTQTSSAEDSTISQITAPGMVMGTVRYMSPEQARGKDVDARTDIWSLGVVLYEMIAGKAPFGGESNTDILAAIIDKEPPPLVRFAVNSPPELERIVGKMLRKERDSRYQTMKDALIDLKDLRDELQLRAKLKRAYASDAKAQAPVNSEAKTAQEATAKSRREVAAQTVSNFSSAKTKMLFAAIALIAVAAVSFTLWKFLSNTQKANETPMILRTTQITVWTGMDICPAFSPDGKQFAFNSKRSGTTNIWKIPVEGGAARQLTFDKELMGYPHWSPDGKWLAFEMKRGGDTHVAIMPSDGGEITQLTFDKGQSWSHSFSPDGDKIAFAGLRNDVWNIYWVSRSTKQQKQLTNYTKGNYFFVRYPAWSSLGNQIVYEYNEINGNIWIADLK